MSLAPTEKPLPPIPSQEASDDENLSAGKSDLVELYGPLQSLPDHDIDW